MLCENIKSAPKGRKLHKCTHESYGLKHHLEIYRKLQNRPSYITNGDFCLAMLLLGYPIRKSKTYKKSLAFQCVSLVEYERDKGTWCFITKVEDLLIADEKKD